MNIGGQAELIRSLRGLRRKAFEAAAAEVMEPHVRPVAESVRGMLSLNRSVDTGALLQSIGAVVRVYPRKQRIAAYIGPQSGHTKQDDTGKVRDPVRYAHLVEFGAAPHKINRWNRAGKKRTINHPGMRGQPFMRPAWDAKKHGLLESIGADLGNIVERIAAEVANVPAKASGGAPGRTFRQGAGGKWVAA
jgi:hypothetical protein